jgi:molybdopterin-binding protein
LLAGLENPTSGSLLFEGKLITDVNRQLLRQNATMVFQKSVFFDTTVFKNIAYGLKVKGCAKREMKAKVRKVLDLVRLEGFEERRVKKLSGGEQQRVSLARALVLDIAHLLLDEPTVNVDPKNVSIIEEAIVRVNREKNTTITLATHNMFQAETISERVALLLEGTIKQVGTKQEIFGATNRYLASFARLENVFSGLSKIGQTGTSVIAVDPHLQIEASFHKSGETTLHVRPEDIIVSTSPLNSSARNTFKGKIVATTEVGSVVKLGVDVGRKFTVQITRTSFREMHLGIGSTVFLTFKASSVHLV